MSDSPSLLKQFIAGGVGGVCLVLVGHPLDTIKVLFATNPGKYTGVMDCARQIMGKRGIAGLYTGMSAPLAGVTPMYAMCFFGYGIGQKIFCRENSFRDLELTRISLAGMTSGLFTTPILAPGERLKVVLQTNNTTEVKYSGPMEVARHLYGKGGYAGMKNLCRGFQATMARDSLGSAVYFSSYEWLKRSLAPADGSGASVAGILTAGGFAGILNWVVALPLDVCKSIYQADITGQYSSARAVFFDLMKKDGPRALYRGFAPVMLRAFPANAACFLGYESAMKGLTYLGVP